MHKYTIAVGKSRFEKRWQNKQVTWETLLKKISVTHRTAETLDEYKTATADRQSEIKDIGGFVGGHLTGGRRVSGSVMTRSILTLDADYATQDFWDKFCLMYECEAAIYSTHKHSAETPRFRLVIPLNREVLCDEYSAICRRIAGDLGIEMFDATGYQIHRLMYWPSTSKDADFVFENQKGDILDADKVLSTYKDWQDVSEWPISLRENKIVSNEAKKQGDPLEKPGLIGAFCRSYTIEDVIETFLPDVYLPCDVPGRYTFAEGSTAAGVVVYDEKFSYSHHSTDITCATLCNAFDLVRLHKFGLLDIDTEAPTNKRPSYLAMCDFVAKDKKVKKELGEAKIADALDAFSGVTVDDEDMPEKASKDKIDMSWLDEMDIDRKGNYLATINNIALILEKDPIFLDNIAFDSFKQQPVFRRNTPWRKVKDRPAMNDNDVANIENYIEKVYKIQVGTKLNKGLLVVLEKKSFHPITDYLKSLVWDGKPRVDTLLVDYLGAELNQYTTTVTRKALTACVARVMQPGVKFDNVLTLVGAEGQGKSALWDRLGGKWFSDTFNMHMLQSKEAFEQIQGVWVIEIGELAGMAKAEVERVKGFIAARMDNYRTPYGRTTEQRLRQCVFFASTNTNDFLKSQNGNRRFWPVATFQQKPKFNVYEMTSKDVDQIWAEAVEFYANDEPLFLDLETAEIAKKVQTIYTEENPLVEQIEHFAAKLIPVDWYNLTKWEKIEFMQNYDENNTEGLVERDRLCKYEIWELVLNERCSITLSGWQNIKKALEKITTFEKTNEQVRFGTSYPKHKGSYLRTINVQNLVK